MMEQQIDMRKVAKDDYNVGIKLHFYRVSMEDAALVIETIESAIDGLPKKLTMTHAEMEDATN